MKHKLKHVPQVVSIKYRMVPIFEVCCCILILMCIMFNSQTKVYSGCLGKISRFISDQYMFAGYTLVRCATQSMANGEITVPVAAKIIAHGIKIHNSG